MNVYTWLDQEVQIPANECADYWQDLDRSMKRMDLTTDERRKAIQTGQLPALEPKEQVRRELADLPLFSLLYGSGVLCLLEYWLSGKFQMNMPVGPGLILQFIGIYAILKVLLYALNQWPKGPGRWASLIGVFLCYLLVIWLCTNIGVYWFWMPVWLGILLFALPWSMQYVRRWKVK